MKAHKKPVVVDCLVWDGKSRPMFDFLNQTENQHMEDKGDNFHIELDNGACQQGSLIIHTLEGDMKANIGDVIIRGVNGEYYPCKPDIFQKTYEVVEG